MTERVREILSWYAGSNPGTLTQPGAHAEPRRARREPARWSSCRSTRASSTARRAASRRTRPATTRATTSSSPSRPAATPTRRRSASSRPARADFAGEIPLILKLNNHDSLDETPDPCSAITGIVDDALRLGCVGHRLHDLPGLGAAQRDVREAARAGRGGEARRPRRRRLVVPARLGDLEGRRDRDRRRRLRGADRRPARRARRSR